MKAMVLNKYTNVLENREPLILTDIPLPVPRKHELLIKISACGVCHTELDEIEGRTPPPVLPIILGHQAVGIVEQDFPGAKFSSGDRVGVAWFFSSCGNCQYCLKENENLCQNFKATGRDANGGYAEYMTVPENAVFLIPPIFSDYEAAPLLCAGAIGYRSMRLVGMTAGQNLGLTGFGASAHLVLKMVRHRYPAANVFVFARSEQEQEFARELGAVWAGDTTEESPEKLDCIIDTTPVWLPVVNAMRNLKPGGRLVINAIRKEDIDKKFLLNIDYSTHLWLEKEIKSVANVTRRDVREFLSLAAEIPIKPVFQLYSLDEANKALVELKERKIRGAKVLRIA